MGMFTKTWTVIWKFVCVCFVHIPLLKMKKMLIWPNRYWRAHIQHPELISVWSAYRSWKVWIQILFLFLCVVPEMAMFENSLNQDLKSLSETSPLCCSIMRVYKICDRLVKTQLNYSLFSTICTIRTNNYMFRPILGHLQVASCSLGGFNYIKCAGGG
jgi:hypothetical protein